jgi:hypothetical protein
MLTEQNATWQDGGEGLYMALLQAAFELPLSIDNSATLTVDGTEYTGTVADYSSTIGSGAMGFGDVEAYLASDLESLNYMVTGMEYNGATTIIIIVRADVSPTSCTLTGMTQEIIPVPEKYLDGALIPKSAAEGQMFAFTEGAWGLINNPHEWEEIKNIIPNGSSHHVTLRKNYSELFIELRYLASGLNTDSDVTVTTLASTDTSYHLGVACNAVGGGSTSTKSSFIHLVKLPFGWVSVAPTAPFNGISNKYTEGSVKYGFSTQSLTVDNDTHTQRDLYIQSNVLKSTGRIVVYGKPERRDVYHTA